MASEISIRYESILNAEAAQQRFAVNQLFIALEQLLRPM